MWTRRAPLWRLSVSLLLVVSALALTARGDEEVPSEKQCRPYIEKALKDLESGDAEVSDSAEKNDSREVGGGGDSKEIDSGEDATVEDDSPSVEVAEGAYVAHASVEDDQDSKEDGQDQDSGETKEEGSQEGDGDSNDATAEDNDDTESDENKENVSDETKDDNDTTEDGEDDGDSKEVKSDDTQEDNSQEETTDEQDNDTKEDDTEEKTTEGDDDSQDGDSKEEDDSKESDDSKEKDNDTAEDDNDTKEDTDETQEDVATQEEDSKQDDTDSKEDESSKDDDQSDDANDTTEDETKEGDETKEDDGASAEDDKTAEKDDDSKEDTAETGEDAEDSEAASEDGGADDSDEEGAPEEDLLMVGEIPENLRSRKHIEQILRLNEEASEAEITIDRAAEIILRDVKKLYENNIKPLETVYKYRDLSNRHFGDPEIFSKPLVLFMGPWSGGKSTILNYLTGLEFTEWSLRSGAEPSPAYFNILMHGSEPEVLDGTQLAADFTFSGLQKFGQGLEERLRGLKHPSKILEKVNIVEIPGILEVRKQVSRVFPFNDACQWFIDRADIIFLVYDPSKLDVGPETEAILDQLKGRESQTRIVLNKADSVKAEELMRVQSALIWNISPLMSSAQPPAMYTVSLWSMPWHEDTPVRLLLAQEKALLQDLRTAIDRRIENKIASARRFAVRVRNHAKMVDCYLTTYYNHKTIFGNKRLIADAIIENPQNYHIYEGLSTLTNISRYDLPDPETYRDFFRLNPLYEFQPLSSTCTYFRGCPLTKLDVCIAYDLPELVGKYKKMVETSAPQGMPKS